MHVVTLINCCCKFELFVHNNELPQFVVMLLIHTAQQFHKYCNILCIVFYFTKKTFCSVSATHELIVLHPAKKIIHSNKIIYCRLHIPHTYITQGRMFDREYVN